MCSFIFRFVSWDLNIHGDVEKEIESRGLLDPEVLPFYPFRDDSVKLYKIIKSYVHKVVHYYYGKYLFFIASWYSLNLGLYPIELSCAEPIHCMFL
jgi:hypothetical protein